MDDAKEKISEILRDLKPGIDFDENTRFVEDGLFDSFDIITLVSELDAAFGISIDGTKIAPEYFATLGDIERLVRNSKKK